MDVLSLFWSFMLYTCTAGLIFLIVLSVILKYITKPYPELPRYKEEETFYDPVSKTRVKFPSIRDEYSVNLTVVVPAYNEEKRLPPMLDEALEVLENSYKGYPAFKYEIIIVSDGSTDDTVKVAHSYAMKYGSEKIRCLELIKNRGKGGAVKMGVQSSRGSLILFADADGASKFEDLAKLEAALKGVIHVDPVARPDAAHNNQAIIIGSRAHLEKESLATRSIFRNTLMYVFHFLVWFFTVKDIKDTQCGFKMFTRKTADICFDSLHVYRWAFDVELLLIAQKLNIPITEVSVRWTEIEGSKVTPVVAWVQMGCDLGLIWLKYRIGAWLIKRDKLE